MEPLLGLSPLVFSPSYRMDMDVPEYAVRVRGESRIVGHTEYEKHGWRSRSTFRSHTSVFDSSRSPAATLWCRSGLRRGQFVVTAGDGEFVAEAFPPNTRSKSVLAVVVADDEVIGRLVDDVIADGEGTVVARCTRVSDGPGSLYEYTVELMPGAARPLQLVALVSPLMLGGFDPLPLQVPDVDW